MDMNKPGCISCKRYSHMACEMPCKGCQRLSRQRKPAKRKPAKRKPAKTKRKPVRKLSESAPTERREPIDYSGRSYRGLDADAYYQYDLAQWMSERPARPDTWGSSEDSMAFYYDALQRWAQRAPNNTWDDR